MPKKTPFNQRFRELVKGYSDTELGVILGVTADTARKMRLGNIQSLKLQAALRLARQLNVSPWYLGGEEEQETHMKALLHKKQDTTKITKSAKFHSKTDEHLRILQDEVAELRARIFRLENAIT